MISRHPHIRAIPPRSPALDSSRHPDRSAACAALRASMLAACVAFALLARPAAAAEAIADAAIADAVVAETAAAEAGAENAPPADEDPFASPAPLLPLVLNGMPNADTWSSAAAFDGGMVSPMSVIEPPPALNNTLPGLASYLQNWLLGADYQACGLLGSGCLTIDRANFNYSYLSLVLNLIQAPNVLDLDGNQPANHLTLIGAVQSDSYIQFQDSNYYGNNNNASCVVIGLACTWRTNAAQNNQVLIGDGSYANGSNTIVMGTNARHQLPTITAAQAGFTGGPDSNYAARLGNSVVIGDNSFGNADRQTILGFGATSTHANSVALGAGSSTSVGAQTGYVAFGLAAPQNSAGEVSIGAAGAARKLSNVAAGSIGTDAVNLAQLQGALATAASDPFAVKYDNLGGSPNLQSISLQGAGGTLVSNLRAGAVNAGSNQAINGAQLFAVSQSNAQRLGGGAAVAVDGTVTAPNYVIAGNGYNNVGAALAALDGNAQALDAFAVQYDDDGAGNPNYAAITLRGPAGTGTTLGNLAAGQIAAGSLQAINGGQIFGLGTGIANIFGGGAAFNAGGSFTAPNYVIAGNTYTNVGSALSALDNGVNAGNAFAVQYDDDGAGNPNYAAITLRGPAGTGTVLDNLAAGQIAAGSLQAVNGGQISTMGDSIASIFGGGSLFNAGTFGAPSYTVQGGSYTNIGAAFAAVDASLTNLNNRIDNLPPATTPDPRVAIDGTGNASVAAGSRGVAVGASASAGGSRATAIGGDSYAAGANDTAIGGNARVNADGSTALGANSSVAAGATNAVAIGESASVSASGAVALGQGAVADRANTVSVGNAGQQRQIVNVAAGSQDNDAVNLAQLKASQAGTVRYDSNPDGSVNTTQVTLNNGGAATTIRNVRAGTANTDAVNVQQLNEGVNRAITTSNQYTDNWGNQLRNEIGRLDDKASAGVASAMAVAGLPQSYMPGKSMAAIAASSFRGESGFAIGISTITEDGRYVYKISGNSNSKGDVGVTVGAGIVW